MKRATAPAKPARAGQKRIADKPAPKARAKKKPPALGARVGKAAPPSDGGRSDPSAKKASPKRAGPKKQAPKKVAKAAPHSSLPKKNKPNHIESREKPPIKTKGEPAARAEPRTAVIQQLPKDESMKMSDSSESAEPLTKNRSVLRIAAGTRTPKAKSREEQKDSVEQVGKRIGVPSAPAKPGMKPAPKVEINPKLQSSRGIIGSAEGEKKERPMSVAQKNRAAAEAAFLRVAEPRAPSPVPAAPSNGVHAPTPGPGQPHKSAFEMRISERDSLTTSLRLAESKEAAIQAAQDLAERFQLPPDQSLLVKVIGLGDERLTKLALEELLELDDRGRVRRTPDLREALDRLKSRDRETTELKELLLEKMGAFGA
jgi:hypothetical protein